MGKIAVFAGTSEGRALCQQLSRAGVPATAFVATAYGSAVMHGLPGIRLSEGRLDESEMTRILSGYATVVDATHPYAAEASRNLRKAAESAGTRYLRLLRPHADPGSNLIVLPDAAAAAAFLATVEGNILLTTGSKELAVYMAVPGLAERLYIRLLPDPGLLKRALELGVSPSRIIAMQGPFSHELNAALLRDTGARWLVTKDTGAAGGLPQKLSSAEETGAKVVMIARPPEPAPGHSLEEIFRILTGEYPLSESPDSPSSPPRFPLFLDLAGKPCLVVGGGRVGLRRARILREFGADVTVVSPSFRDHPGGIRLVERCFLPGDTAGMRLVAAATDLREVNHQIALECGEGGIPVSVADCAEECSFYFPAICQTKNLTAGLISRGDRHRLVSQTAAAIRRLMEEMDR